ncbi:MAG TPA: chemotaxis protein CheW [Candidatus Limnocylindria bacterium]|jgi:purine-binding chemotaxis protein CheW|nr:chemotaxis protein CheW [Candidatus Limnocylindria bacterium]
MSATTADKPTATGRHCASGKYLTFRLGAESYGVGVLRVREIMRQTDITPVPQMPAYVKGVINLRGKIIPIIDLRLKFGLVDIKDTEQTCIVVVQVKQPSGVFNMMGLLVDAVEEVTNIGGTDIEETPDFGSSVQTDYILGMAKVKNSVKTLLDMDKVIACETLVRIQAAAR